MMVVEKVIGVLSNVSSIVPLLLCAVLTFSVTALVWRQLTYWRKYSWPPGPRGWPLVGNSPMIAPDSGQTNANITRIGKQYHPHVFTLTLYFGKKVLVLNSYKAMKDGLIRQSELISNRPPDWPFIYINRNHKSVGIFFESYTNSWKREKKYMMRTVRHFGYGTLASQPFIQQEANHLVELIKKRKGQPFLLGGPASLCFLNVTFPMIFSATYEEDDQEFSRIQDIIRNWFTPIFNMYNVEPFLPLLDMFGLSSRLKEGKRTTEDLLSFVKGHIDRHRASLDPANPRDMLDECLIEMAKGGDKSDLSRQFQEENLQWMLIFFILDQGDTSTGLFLFLMLATARYPEVQQRVFQEIQDVIGDRPPSLKDKEKMPYTEAVILETLRMDTNFWLWIAHFTADDVDVLGYKIPKDTTVIPNIYAVHFDPDLWGDPETFRPERFINQQGTISKPEYLIPFSIGRRRCIGEHLTMKEFFLFYITVLQNFKFKLPESDTKPKLEAKFLEVHPEDYLIIAEPRE